MKRSRAEGSSSNKLPASPPTRTQKRTKESNPKPMKARKGPKRTAPAPAAAEPTILPPAAHKEKVEVGWVGEHSDWSWGVEELLLGWFPFVPEDFLWFESREGSSAGVFWEEEEEVGECYDIWQLQNIHEIPNPTAK